MNTLTTHLNQQLANSNVLYVKLQNYHWNVKGEQFFVLHEKFQTFYEELASAIDEIAERILMIGGVPLGTIKQFLETSTISEASESERADQMVAQLEKDYEQLVRELKQAISVAEDAGDVSTADLLTGLAASFEKNVWMLQAYMATSMQHA